MDLKIKSTNFKSDFLLHKRPRRVRYYVEDTTNSLKCGIHDFQIIKIYVELFEVQTVA